MIGILILLVLFCIGTILLESIPCLFVREKLAWWRAGIICNVVTNPVLNVTVLLVGALLPQLDIRTPVLLVLEVVVVFLEAYFYKKLLDRPYLHCLLFSCIANLLSFGIGLLFQNLFSYTGMSASPLDPFVS